MRASFGVTALAVATLIGCIDPPTNIILRVADPDNLAGDADTLALGQDLEELERTPLDGNEFPLNLTVTGFEENEVVLLWVDALAGGEVVARGRTRVVFPDDGTEEFIVTLAAPCNPGGNEDGTLGCALSDSPDEPGSAETPERGVCIAGRCGRSLCGDGVVDASNGELCDDGDENTQDDCPDGPTGTCEPARCGDGFLYTEVEPCDDGNDVNEDSCRSEFENDRRVCVVNVCGDGVVNAAVDPSTGVAFEECDDGNDLDEDACRIIVEGGAVRCVANVCGDGFVNRLVVGGEQVEDCDDANTNPNDSCNACAAPMWDVTVRFGVGDSVGRPTLQDGDPSTLSLEFVTGLTTTSDGDLIISDALANQIWRYDAESNRVVRVAGIGSPFAANLGFPRDYGDGGPALLAGLTPFGGAVDSRYNLYVADRINRTGSSAVFNNRIRRISLISGVIDTVVGSERSNFDASSNIPGAPLEANLRAPTDVAVTADGTLFIADTESGRVHRLPPGDDAILETVAGDGDCCPLSGPSIDALDAGLCWIRDVTPGPEGAIYISTEEPPPSNRPDCEGSALGGSDTGAGDQIWRLDGSTLTLIAGNGERTGVSAPGRFGDGGPAVAANLFTPWGLAFDSAGRLYVADADHHIVRRVDLNEETPTIHTVAGTSTRGRVLGPAAVDSQLDRPIQLAVLGNTLFIGEVDERLLSLPLDDGASFSVFAGVPGPETLSGLTSRSLTLDIPRGSAATSSGDLYVADQGAGRIYRVVDEDGLFPPAGSVETVAGSGGYSVFVQAFAGDDGPATSAGLNQPYDVAVDADGTLYIADTANHRIRRVDPVGVISTFAGSGLTDSAFGDANGVGILDLVANADPLTVNDGGTLLEDRVKRNSCGATPALCFSGDGGPATSAALTLPTDVEVAPNGDLYIADFLNRRIRRVRDGVITTVAGDGEDEYDGPSGPGIGKVADMAVTASGQLFFTGFTLPDRYSIWRLDTDTDELVEVTRLPLDSDRRLEGIAATEAAGSAVLYVGVGDDDLGIDDVDDFVFRIVPGTNDGSVTSVELIAGNAPGSSQLLLDGLPGITARLRTIGKMSSDAQGNWFYADEQVFRLRGFDSETGVIDTVLGRVGPGDGERQNAALGAPTSLVYDESQALWLVTDDLGLTLSPPNTGTVRAVDLQANTIRTEIGQDFGSDARFDLQPATTHRGLWGIGGIAVDPDTNALYLSETSFHHAIYRVDRTDENPTAWTIERVAGFSEAGGTFPRGNDAAALESGFDNPRGLALDAANQLLYVANAGLAEGSERSPIEDNYGHTIRLFDLGLETVATLAGAAGEPGFAGDDEVGQLDDARFRSPSAVALACDGSLYVADTGNNRVRRIDLSTNTISTVLGNGVASSTGEGEAAATLPVEAPLGLAFDRFGNLFVTSSNTVRVIEAGEDGTCADGIGLPTGEDLAFTIYGRPPRRSYPQTVTQCLTGVALDPNRNDRAFVLDGCQGFFLELERR